MANQLRIIGIRFICGTLAGIAFAIIGVLIGPTELVAALLAIGSILIVTAHCVEKRTQRRATDADSLKEN